VAANPSGQELVHAEPQHVTDGRIDLVPVAARGQDRVIGAAAAQRAVGQFGGKGGVPAGQAAFRQDGGQQQVSVGVALIDRAQDVIGGPARRIRTRPART
jgi:hypothetical protein